MNILFIGYWPFDEGLTQSTILPHLEILADFPQIKQIIFISIERNGRQKPHSFTHPKLKHIPLHTQNLPVNIINKLNDFVFFPKLLKDICIKFQINYMICRGAPAGALGYLISQKIKVPFIVESFEPHAEYMHESGVWRWFDPRYLFQKYWEQKQKKLAKHLMPVSLNYTKKLIEEGVPCEKVSVVPCEVNLGKFYFSDQKRELIRKKLGINDEERTVGIYVGKFGDIYFDEEAFVLFSQALKHFGERFFLIILSPQEKGLITKKLEVVGFPPHQAFIDVVPHEEIPDYLSASDFAFSTIKPSPHRKYCSPIKNGEYWACGLPILIPENIGDDSQILKETGLGVIINDLKNTVPYFLTIEKLIKGNRRTEIRELAIKYRNPEISRKAYEKLFGG